MHKLHSYNFTYGDSDTSTNLATSDFSLIFQSPTLMPIPLCPLCCYTCSHSKSAMPGKKLVKENLAKKINYFNSYFNFLIKWQLSHTAGIRWARTSIQEWGLFRLALSTKKYLLSSVIRCWPADVRPVNQGLDQRNPLLHWQKFTWPLQIISIPTDMPNRCTATLQEFWFPFNCYVKGRVLAETVFAGQT